MDREQIILDHMYIVHAMIWEKKYYGDIEDIISTGYLGLIKAVDSFDPDRGANLKTYIVRCVRNEIYMYFRKLKKAKKDLHYENIKRGDEPYLDSIPDTSFDIDRDLTIYEIMKIVRSLTHREMEYIRFRYLLGLKQGEVSEIMRFTQSYGSRFERNLLLKIRRMYAEAG